MNRLARQLLNEAPIDTGEYPDIIDRGVKDKFKRRTHPLGKNPAYPDKHEGLPNNFEELMASGNYKLSVQKFNQYASRLLGNEFKIKSAEQFFMNGGMMAFQAIQQAIKIEQAHKPQLQQAAINLVMELPEFKSYAKPLKAGEFKIKAILGKLDTSKIKIGGDEDEEEQFTPESEDDAEEKLDKVLTDMDIQKRRFVDAMVHGSATARNYAFHMAQDVLNAIDPKLVNLYGLAMSYGDLGYFAASDEMMRGALGSGEAQGGMVRITWEGDTPVVNANADIFPVLVQEIIKGLMELASMEGLPNDPKRAQHVIDKTGLMDQERWAIIMGKGMWNQLIQQVDQQELVMFLYHKMVKLPPEQFNVTMKTLLSGGPQAKRILAKWVAEIQEELGQEE